jgi:hypothetical protein
MRLRMASSAADIILMLASSVCVSTRSTRRSTASINASWESHGTVNLEFVAIAEKGDVRGPVTARQPHDAEVQSNPRAFVVGLVDDAGIVAVAHVVHDNAPWTGCGA